MRKVLIYQQDFINDKEFYNRVVVNLSNESVLDFMKSATVYVGELFGKGADLFEQLTAPVSYFFGGDTKKRVTHSGIVAKLLALKPDMRKVIEKVDYDHVESLNIPIIPGMSSPLLEFTVAIDKVFEMLGDNVEYSLNSLEDRVNKILGSEMYRTATNGEPGSNVSQLKSILKECQTELGRVVSRRNVNDSAKLRELIPNLTTIELAFNNLIDMSHNYNIDITSRIQKQIANITEKLRVLEVIARGVNTTGDLKYDHYIPEHKNFTMSKKVSEQLGSAIEVNADLVALSASVMHMYNNACITTMNLISRSLNPKDAKYTAVEVTSRSV